MRILIALLLCTGLSAQNVVWSVNNPSPLVSVDKRGHFLTGAWGGLMVGVISRDLFHAKHPWLWSLLAGLTVGIAKETYDRRHGGKAEIADALNTTVGATLGGVTFSVRW